MKFQPIFFFPLCFHDKFFFHKKNKFYSIKLKKKETQSKKTDSANEICPAIIFPFPLLPFPQFKAHHDIGSLPPWRA